MTVTIDVLDTDGTLVQSGISGLSDIGWSHPRVGSGSGTLTIRNDHPDYDDFTARRLVRCNLDGSAAFTWMLQRKTVTRLSQDGPGGKVTVWTGAGALSVLGMGEYHSAVVVGDGDTGFKTFGWITEDYDDSAWSEPTSRGLASTLLVEDVDWPDDTAEWIGSADGGSASYLRRFLETSARTQKAGDVRIFATGKGDWRLWVDGQEKMSGDADDVGSVDFTLDANDHQLALKVDSGPGLLTIVRVNDDGSLGGVIYRSFTQGVFGTGDPDPWKGKEGGSTPTNITATYVASRLLSAAQTRSSLTGVTENFTDTTDTDGVTLTVGLEIVRYRDGQQVGDVIQQLRHQFSVDVQMSPSLELQIYESLGSDLSASVQLTDADPAAAAAVLDTQSQKANASRIETTGGFGWDPSASGIPTGESQRLETAATYGTALSVSEVTNAAQELVDDLKGVVRQTVRSAAASGSGERAYTDFSVGDQIAVREADGGSYVASKVEAITVENLDGGEQDFDIDLERRL